MSPPTLQDVYILPSIRHMYGFTFSDPMLQKEQVLQQHLQKCISLPTSTLKRTYYTTTLYTHHHHRRRHCYTTAHTYKPRRQEQQQHQHEQYKSVAVGAAEMHDVATLHRTAGLNHSSSSEQESLHLAPPQRNTPTLPPSLIVIITTTTPIQQR